jgi:hypothetical protein
VTDGGAAVSMLAFEHRNEPSSGGVTEVRGFYLPPNLVAVERPLNVVNKRPFFFWWSPGAA